MYDSVAITIGRFGQKVWSHSICGVRVHRCGALRRSIRTVAKMETAGLGLTQNIYSPLVHTQKHGPTCRDPQRSRYDTSKQRRHPLREIDLSKSSERRWVTGVRRILRHVSIFPKGNSAHLTRRSSMTRVFKTSRGVVSAAAIPPAALPHNEASKGRKDEGL